MKEKVLKIIETLSERYPNPKLELEYSNAFELLLAAILAAQAPDKRVNEITKSLFKKYPSPQVVVDTPLEELEKDIRSINFYKRKAKLIKECCEALVERFGGKVPDNVEDMTELPGIGRKTANMVVGGAFGLPAIIVDRHVMRVAQRIGLTKQKNADKIEKELMQVVPKDKWTTFSLLLMTHGKEVCTAKAPRCDRCAVCEMCDSCGRL